MDYLLKFKKYRQKRDDIRQIPFTSNGSTSMWPFDEKHKGIRLMATSHDIYILFPFLFKIRVYVKYTKSKEGVR